MTAPLHRVFLAMLVAVLAAACGGPGNSFKKKVGATLAKQDFVSAEAMLIKAKESEYGKKNAVLYNLDLATVLHHAGKYKESDALFDKAETRMDDLYTVSISKTGAQFIANDNTVDYSGEPFERALLNVFRALNYVYLNKPEEAVVEARKVESFLSRLNEGQEKKSVYKDDAFARYLDSLLYGDIGKEDDARISRHAAEAAYKWYTSDYRVPAPRMEPAGIKTENMGEVVFIHYNGIAPRKVSNTLSVAWGHAMAVAQATSSDNEDNQQLRNGAAAGIMGDAITVAFPAFVQDKFEIQASDVDAGAGHVEPTALVEDISAIAIKDLADRAGAIQGRAIARAVIKFITAELAAQAAARACDARLRGFEAAACRFVTRGAAFGIAAGTEVADTRSWTTVPAQIRMARMWAPAGKRDVTVRFKSGYGSVVATHVFKDVQVRPNRRTYLHYRTAR